MSEGSDASAARHVRVFYAEDNDDLAFLVKRRVEARPGWSLVRARTSEEASARLRGDRFDVVVLDYKLPDGDGLALLQVLRATAPETPVLFLTAHGSEDVALQALGLGATDYMQKTGGVADELPARLDALLASESDVRQASRVLPIQEGSAFPDVPERRPRRATLDLQELVRGDVRGVAVFDLSGRAVAALLPEGLDAAMLGAALLTLHAQVGVLARLTGLTPLRHTFQLHVEGAVLAAASTPTGAMLAVLVDPESGDRGAQRRLEEIEARLG